MIKIKVPIITSLPYGHCYMRLKTLPCKFHSKIWKSVEGEGWRAGEVNPGLTLLRCRLRTRVGPIALSPPNI